jgi:hypothetical protein
MKRTLLLFTLLPLFALGGCETEQHKAQVEADMKALHDTSKATQDDLQWKLDDETATEVFSDDPDGTSNYLMFRQCHEEPPTKAANKKVCANLQRRVARAEAKAQRAEAKRKANW